MNQKLIQVTENYYALRRSDNERFEAIDIGKLRRNGPGIDADIHVASHYEWTHASDYTKEEWTPAKVNWPSIGAQRATVTTEFAKALIWAAKQAARMDRKRKVRVN